jgi:hypothetical protein
MKTQRRHELATNELADRLGKVIERAKPYTTSIVGTVLACAVLAGGYLVYRGRSASKVEEGWSNYFAALDEGKPDALRNVADEFATTPAGHWSRLSLADAMLAKGVQQLFDDRDAAEESLKDAVAGYSEVIKRAPPDSLLAERATYGLGEAFESLGELSKAREQYTAVQERWKQGAFNGQAQQRLADLDRDSTREFYDWFATQHPRPKETSGPDKKPSFGADGFDLDKLPFDSQSTGEKKTKSAPANDSLMPDTSLSDTVRRRGKPHADEGDADKSAGSDGDRSDDDKPAGDGAEADD